MRPLVACLAVLVVVSWAYWAAAAAAVWRLLRRRPGSAGAGVPSPPVSVLKPVYGTDPGALESLGSFCDQTYPEYEVVFGVADLDDPAIPVLEEVRTRRPGRRIRLLVSPPRPGGANHKACLLEALARAASHDVLVAADADMRVGPDYLGRVVAALQQPGVALVTCPYRAEDARSPWARLEALHMGVTFLPSAVLAGAMGVPFAMGATIAVRRADLQRTGGFAALKDCLADDFELGARVSALGRRVAICPYIPRSVLGTTSLRETWDRELRWSRCNWISHPLGYLGYAFTFSVPLALTFFFVAHRGALGLAAVGGSLAIRGSSAAVIALRTRDRAALRGLALLPVRDLLSAAVWGAALLSRRVVWRGRVFRIDHHGHLHPTPRRSRPAHRRHPGSAPVPHG